MISFLRYLLLFFFYSTAGWVVESTYCSIGEKRLVNRGFMTGPMCPIYGTGALVMTLFMYNPYKDRPLIVFLLGMLLCDIVEYFTSVIMETLFHARWWDYTYEFLNIKGRICLKHTLFWGIASVAFVFFFSLYGLYRSSTSTSFSQFRIFSLSSSVSISFSSINLITSSFLLNRLTW